MSWHVEEQLVLRYQEGAVDRVTGASLEAHLAACADCRGLVKADPEWLESSWRGIAERVEPGKPGPLERLLTAVGVPQHHARVAAVSPALRASFLLAVVLVLGFSVLAAASDPAGRTYLIFLFVAPVLPVAGVAFSYGRRVDPAHELTLATPIDALRLLLLRAASVLVVAVGLGLLAWPLVPDPRSLGVSAWLLPALALTLVTLALASRMAVVSAAALVGGGWLLVILLAFNRSLDAFNGTAQTVYAAVGVAAVVVMLSRRHHYDREGDHR